MTRTLRSCVEHTNFDLSHHIAFWKAVEQLLPPGALEDDGELGSLWVSATPAKQPELANLQSWLTFLTGAEVRRQSKGKIRPLTAAEACGFIGCIIVETGRPLLDRLDVVEAGSGAGRGAMQYTGVRRVAYDKARSAAIAKGIDPSSNSWQQAYFAEEYAGMHDPPQGSLIGWTKVFEDRPAGMDPSRAAAHWTAHYFRPGVPHLDRRQQEAQRVWGLVQSKQLSAATALPLGSALVITIPAGMVGPKKAPPLKPGDHHLVADDRAETLTAYTHDGKRLWSIPCLCRGQGREAEWKTTGSDTPPGLYLIGEVYRDYEEDPSATFSADRRAYGWYSFDMIGQEGQEGPGSRYGRDGIMMHGGGTACGWPGAWAPRQALHSTLGCIRLHNVDLRDRVLPLLDLGRVWVSVLQEAG
jgi:hypothetical protein